MQRIKGRWKHWGFHLGISFFFSSGPLRHYKIPSTDAWPAKWHGLALGSTLSRMKRGLTFQTVPETDREELRGLELTMCLLNGYNDESISESSNTELKDTLLQEHQYFPVMLALKRESLFYHGFCKNMLWPLFDSSPPTTEEQIQSHVDSTDDTLGIEKTWAAYVAVNQGFADAIQVRRTGAFLELY